MRRRPPRSSPRRITRGLIGLAAFALAGCGDVDRAVRVRHPAPSRAPPAAVANRAAPPRASGVAAEEHLRAVARAAAETDAATRERNVFAAVADWAAADPFAAAQWALAQPEEVRAIRIEAVLTGVARDSAAALAFGRAWLRAHPDTPDSFRLTLLGALVRAGDFAAAIAWSEATPGLQRHEWLEFAFERWAPQHPEAALRGIAVIDDPAARSGALHALLRGWATENPAELAACITLLPGAAQSYAREQVMLGWTARDPAAFAQWLMAQPPTPATDRAVAWLVTHTDAANRSESTAMAWARRIQDPMLRQQTLAQLDSPRGEH